MPPPPGLNVRTYDFFFMYANNIFCHKIPRMFPLQKNLHFLSRQGFPPPPLAEMSAKNVFWRLASGSPLFYVSEHQFKFILYSTSGEGLLTYSTYLVCTLWLLTSLNEVEIYKTVPPPLPQVFLPVLHIMYDSTGHWSSLLSVITEEQHTLFGQ